MATAAETINATAVNVIEHLHGDVAQHFGDTFVFPEGASIDDFMEIAHRKGLVARLRTLISEERFRELLKLVTGLSVQDLGEQLYRVCRASLPPTAALRNTVVPPPLLADMCEQPWAKPWPPLLECVERLAQVPGIAGADADDLARWVDATAPELTPQVLAADLARLRHDLRSEAARTAGAQPSWLQVYLESEWLNRTQERKQPQYRVELVLWSPRTNGPQVLSTAVDHGDGTGAELWTLDNLPSLLDSVFADRQNVALIPRMTELAIEIVAPSEALLYGFDRWQRNQGADTYGIRHPIVVRLRDRLAIPDASDQAFADDYWRAKWAAFLSCAGDDGGTLLKWRNPDALDAIELQNDANLFFVGVETPLMTGRRDVFDTLRDAGIPIALWIRSADLGSALPPNWRQLVSEGIKGKPISDLHEAIHQLRRLKEPRSDTNHFVNALTLLWDDPARPPLKYEQQGVFV